MPIPLPQIAAIEDAINRLAAESILAQAGRDDGLVPSYSLLSDLRDRCAGEPALQEPVVATQTALEKLLDTAQPFSVPMLEELRWLVEWLPVAVDCAKTGQPIPPFGAAGNPVDITGGEPPLTYKNTVKLGLEDPRIHALILGYWHTIITPPMVFAKLMVEVKNEMKAKGIEKPMVASLAGDVQVEEAAEYLYANGIPAYAYSTEIPVAVLGAKYKWARGAGLL